MDRGGTESALLALNDILEANGAVKLEMVVCGGSALQIMGLIDRATRDVDILAFMANDGIGKPILLSAEPISDLLRESARIVARDFALPADWLNSGPTQLLDQGLPDGLIDRLHSKSYGRSLVVHFIDRLDQIHFKTYASINGGGLRHLKDLQTLNPNMDEMLQAARWCLTQDASQVFPQIVISFLKQTGYDDVAERLSE